MARKEHPFIQRHKARRRRVELRSRVEPRSIDPTALLEMVLDQHDTAHHSPTRRDAEARVARDEERHS